MLGLKLVECTDHDIEFGILVIKTENVTEEYVQIKICDIKRKFYDNGDDDWTIDDLLMEFPDEWDFEFVDIGTVEC